MVSITWFSLYIAFLFSLGLGLDAKANQNKETKAMLPSIMILIKKNNNTLLSLA
jgi:hypothetical protein